MLKRFIESNVIHLFDKLKHMNFHKIILFLPEKKSSSKANKNLMFIGKDVSIRFEVRIYV